jgi:hypothetical protein
MASGGGASNYQVGVVLQGQCVMELGEHRVEGAWVGIFKVRGSKGPCCFWVEPGDTRMAHLVRCIMQGGPAAAKKGAGDVLDE